MPSGLLHRRLRRMNRWLTSFRFSAIAAVAPRCRIGQQSASYLPFNLESRTAAFHSGDCVRCAHTAIQHSYEQAFRPTEVQRVGLPPERSSATSVECLSWLADDSVPPLSAVRRLLDQGFPQPPFRSWQFRSTSSAIRQPRLRNDTKDIPARLSDY